MPKYCNPPINEVICGLEFEPLDKLTSAYFGLFWNDIRSDFPESNIQDPILSEPFENAQDYIKYPRIWFINNNKDEVIQLQRDRFINNWRKQDNLVYPYYETIIKKYETKLFAFKDFLKKEKIGPVVPKKYELSYINHIPLEGKETKISKIFSILNNLSFPGVEKMIEDRLLFFNIRYGYLLPDNLGSINIIIRDAKLKSDNLPFIILELRAYSDVFDVNIKDLKTWFDQAHEAILQIFNKSAKIEYKNMWGMIE